MKEAKKLIQHELLNTLMKINVLIADNQLNKKNKEYILDLIKLASLLISYENVFLGKKLEAFPQKINLIEILEVVAMIYKKKITDNNIKITLPKNDFYIKIDKQHIQEALGQIIKTLLDSASAIELKFDNQKNKLSISYKAKKIIKFNKKPLIKCLNEKNLTNNEIPLQLALQILAMNKIKFKAIGKGIEIVFP